MATRCCMCGNFLEDIMAHPRNIPCPTACYMPFTPHVTPLSAKGVGRVAGSDRELSVIFNREPSDYEMRRVHELLGQLS